MLEKSLRAGPGASCWHLRCVACSTHVLVLPLLCSALRLGATYESFVSTIGIHPTVAEGWCLYNQGACHCCVKPPSFTLDRVYDHEHHQEQWRVRRQGRMLRLSPLACTAYEGFAGHEDFCAVQLEGVVSVRSLEAHCVDVGWLVLPLNHTDLSRYKDARMTSLLRYQQSFLGLSLMLCPLLVFDPTLKRWGLLPRARFECAFLLNMSNIVTSSLSANTVAKHTEAWFNLK